jgi:hypothetical protein
MTTFDAAHATDFLDQVFGEVNTGRIGICQSVSRGMAYEHFQWIRSAVKRASEWEAGKPQGIYFRCTTLPVEGAEKRGTADDAHIVAFLWSDLDFGTVGHAEPGRDALPLPTSAKDALKIIDAMPTPTLVIHSGGGLYPIWRLDRPVMVTEANRAEVKLLSSNWQQVIKARAKDLGWHYGPVGDLARVLRLPGSINRKSGQERPCRVSTGVAYQWDKLADIAETHRPRQISQGGPSATTPTAIAGLHSAVASARIGSRNVRLNWAAWTAVNKYGLGNNDAVQTSWPTLPESLVLVSKRSRPLFDRPVSDHDDAGRSARPSDRGARRTCEH